VIVLGLDTCNGNPQRWSNGGVLDAGRIWEIPRWQAPPGGTWAGRQAPAQWQRYCRLRCCALRMESVLLGWNQ